MSRTASALRPRLDGAFGAGPSGVDRDRHYTRGDRQGVTAEPASILEFDAVSKRFGDTVTADRLSLTVARGEFFTFLGPSGSGKSTVLRMVAGLERPDDGRILIEGRDVAGVPPWRRDLGMVFQHYAVFPHLSVGENVAYGLKIRKLARGEAGRRVGEMLELVG